MGFDGFGPLSRKKSSTIDAAPVVGDALSAADEQIIPMRTAAIPLRISQARFEIKTKLDFQIHVSYKAWYSRLLEPNELTIQRPFSGTLAKSR